MAVLILRAKQESPATLALVLDAIMSRMVNEDGVIYKEDDGTRGTHGTHGMWEGVVMLG